MSDTVDFVITNENWDRNFDEVCMITDQQWLLLAFDTVKLTSLTILFRKESLQTSFLSV